MDKEPKKKELLKKISELKGTLGGLKSELGEVDDKIAKKKGTAPDTTKKPKVEPAEPTTKEEKTDYDKIVGGWIDEESEKQKEYDKVVSGWIDEEKNNKAEENPEEVDEPVEKEKDYDNIVGSWVDQETAEIKERGIGKISPEPGHGEPGKAEHAPTLPETMVDTIADKQITGALLTKEELEFYFENTAEIYKAIDQKKYGTSENVDYSKLTEQEPEPVILTHENKVQQIADKLASFDTKSMSEEDVAFYKANTKEIEKLLTGEKMREGEAIRKERERLARENLKKNIIDTAKRGKDLGISAINKTKTAFEMFGRTGGALTGMSKDMEPDGIYPEMPDRVVTIPAEPEPASPKTLEQKETELELARRMYLEYKTGSVKNKKDMELFEQQRVEKEKIYQDLKMETVKQLVAEGKIDEAKEFLTKEVELRRAHEIKHGSLWARLKSGAANKIEAWDKWGLDKEGDTSNEKLVNWGKRMVKRTVNISFIGLTSSLIVTGIGNHALSSTSALAGGAGSRLLQKLAWGVGLGTAFDYARTKIPPTVDAANAKKILRAIVLGGGAVIVGGMIITGTAIPLAAGLATGASAAIGYGISKFVKKDKWSEKNITEKIENTKNNFDVNDLDNIENWEKSYREVLQEGEKYRIYRKLTSTAAAVAGSTVSLEMIGLTKDHGMPPKEDYTNFAKNFWGGVKKAGSWISGFFEGGKGGPDGGVPEIKTNPDFSPEAPTSPKIEPAPDAQPKAPDGEKAPENTEPRAEAKPDPEHHDKHEEYAHKKDSDHHTKKYDSAAKRDAYSKVTKSYLGEQGPRPQEEHSSHAKLVHKEVSGYQGHGTSGYVGSDSEYRPGEVHQQTNEQVIHRPDSISVDEMADKVYEKNLKLILNTPESVKAWHTFNSEDHGTTANSFLDSSRSGLGSQQLKNLQDYILRVMKETKIKPKDDESIEDFLSRAFEKAAKKASSGNNDMLDSLKL